jgi:hypothetical protein
VRKLESWRFLTITELTAAKQINASYVSRILRLTLLAPELVEAILDGRQPAGFDVRALREGFPVEWGEQRVALTK